MRSNTLEPVRLTLKALRADLLGMQKRLLQGRDFVHYRVRHLVFTLLAKPEYSHRVFFDNAANYHRSFQHHNLAVTIGYGLICSDGELWRRQRKLTQPAFDKELLMRVVDIASTLTTDLLADLRQTSERNEPVDVFREMQALTMRVMGLALFSVDFKTTPHHFPETVRVALDVAMLRNISPITPPLWLPIKLHRQHRYYVGEVDRFVYRLIDERLRNNEGYTDILSKLIQSYGEDAAKYRRELRDQLVTLFFAGFETTGTALTWTWYLLGQNPEIEARFHSEIDSVFGDKIPSYDDLESLSYTHQIIQESLRLYPPVYTLTRKAVEADQMGECPIHKGEKILLPLHVLHRMPEYWESSDQFCPERFAEGQLTEAQRKIYMPFAAGQRKCMGVNFATLEMLVILSMIGQHFRLRLVEGHQVMMQPAVTLVPRGGMPMNVEPREYA